MATVTQNIDNVITRIKKDPNSGAISRTAVLNFLNESQDMIEAELVLPQAQTSSTLNLVASTQSYSLASDLFKPVLFRYTANDWVLKEIPFLSLQKRNDSSTGNPQEYAVWNNKVYFNPIPSANETSGITYFYIKTLDELVESGAGAGQVTTSLIPANFHWVLERGAEMLMMQMLEYQNRAVNAEIKFKEGIQALRNRYSSTTDNYDSQIFTEDQMDGERNFLWNPYQ